MYKLYIAPTKNTPEINFSPDDNFFIIKGFSAPEDVRSLYYPAIEWTKIFVGDVLEGVITKFSKENPIVLKVDLSYFNSSSAKFLFDIFMELKKLYLSKASLVIEWFYDPEDNDMKFAGEDFSALVDMVFTYTPKEKHQ